MIFGSAMFLLPHAQHGGAGKTMFARRAHDRTALPLVLIRFADEDAQPLAFTWQRHERRHRARL
jgi:hypothetical protein